MTTTSRGRRGTGTPACSASPASWTGIFKYWNSSSRFRRTTDQMLRNRKRLQTEIPSLLCENNPTTIQCSNRIRRRTSGTNESVRADFRVAEESPRPLQRRTDWFLRRHFETIHPILRDPLKFFFGAPIFPTNSDFASEPPLRNPFRKNWNRKPSPKRFSRRNSEAVSFRNIFKSMNFHSSTGGLK